MKKKEFLRRLSRGLRHLDYKEVNSIIDYYDELIEDTMDRRGLSEEEVIRELGPIEDIIDRVDPSSDSKEKIHYDEPKRSNRKVVYEEKSSQGPLVTIILLPFKIIFVIIVIALYIALIGVAIAGTWSGISSIVYGLNQALWYNKIFSIGLGIAIIGGILVAIPVLVLILKVIKKILTYLFKGSKKVRRYTYEG